jgi:hypothetical protein
MYLCKHACVMHICMNVCMYEYVCLISHTQISSAFIECCDTVVLTGVISALEESYSVTGTYRR